MLLFLLISIYMYLYLTFAMDDLFHIDKRSLFVARHMVISSSLCSQRLKSTWKLIPSN